MQNAFSIGRIGWEGGGAQGLRLRIALPFSAQGLPLGVLEAATLGKEDKAAFADRQEDTSSRTCASAHCRS
jgi:hypothetical protein